MIMLKHNKKEGDIFRPSKNRNLFYKVTGTWLFLAKAERYYPNRKPQGRDHYGYDNLVNRRTT